MKFIPLLPDIEVKDAATGKSLKLTCTHAQVLWSMLDDPIWSQRGMVGLRANLEIAASLRAALESGGKILYLKIDDKAAPIFNEIGNRALSLLTLTLSDGRTVPASSSIQAQLVPFVEAAANALDEPPPPLLVETVKALPAPEAPVPPQTFAPEAPATAQA